MKSFAFNFRGGSDENRSLSETFSFEPENIFEKKSGNLYMLGLLANHLPQDQSFLANLAQLIRKLHYGSKHKSVERSLCDSLQDANLYLKDMVISGRVNWMGNLDFSVFALRNRDFFFAKTGRLSIFLLRSGQVVDLAQDLKNYPAQNSQQVFGNLVSGKLNDGDAIIVSTEEVGNFIKKQKIINEIAGIATAEPNRIFDMSSLESVFDDHKLKISSLCGCCLLISLRSDLLQGGIREFRPVGNIKKVSLREMFAGQKPDGRASKLPRLGFVKSHGFPWARLAIGCAVLGFLATGGYLFFNIRLTRSVADIKNQIQAISDQIGAAKSLQASGQVQQARDLLNSQVRQIENIKEASAGFPSYVALPISDIQASANSALMAVNGQQSVNPVIIYQFIDFLPTKIISFKDEILAFDPKTKGAYSIVNGQSKFIDYSSGLDFASASDNSVIFFIRPDIALEYKNGHFAAPINISLPNFDANYTAMGIYSNNLYFIDQKSKSVVKYSRQGKGYSQPQNWLAKNVKITDSGLSLAFDHNAWLLNKNGTIDKYFAGEPVSSLKPNYWPPPNMVAKMITSERLSNLYILDSDGRVIILSKDGRLVKQLVSDKIKGALDFSVDNNGQIVLLSGNQLFKITQ